MVGGPVKTHLGERLSGLLGRSLSRLNPRLAELVTTAEELARSGLRSDAWVRSSLKSLVASGDKDTSLLAGLLLRMSTLLEERTEHLHALAALQEQSQNELRAAKEIQVGLLPKHLPRSQDRAEFELFALIEPARGVGGDVYDYWWVDEHRFFFMIGDVAEKGIPAALLMAVTKTLFNSYVLPNVSLSEAMAKVNDKLAENNESAMFVTVFCGILDVRTGELEYCDGGHNVPCLLPAGAPPRMLQKTTGIALGFMPGFQFQSEKISLSPGDGLFLYTDGITEAMNEARDQYSEARLQFSLDERRGAAPPELVHGVMRDVQRFMQGEPQSDDIAILAVRYRGRRRPASVSRVSNTLAVAAAS
jgi:sigma-B regulation protein RsbU (phosphoserine phosphatase)